MTRHFLNLSDAGGDAIAAMLDDALSRKAARKGWPKGKADADGPLAGHMLAMIFEKSSTRTRFSFEMAMEQLGGSAIVADSGSMQLGRGETVADTARVLSRYVDAIMIRTDDHAKVEEMAACASVPVINALTDLSHPCQIVADLLTVVEHGLALPGSQWAWLGDGNNVLHSIVEAAGLLKFDVRMGIPHGYDPDPGFAEAARAAGSAIMLTRDAAEAVAGADIIVTDTWISMSDDAGKQKIKDLQPFQVNQAVMGAAADDALFLHCLPAKRGLEVSTAVMESAHSVVFDEAENRLHVQKAILLWCLGADW